MSNYLGIAIVTKAIFEIVHAAVQDAVPGTTARIGPPRAEREVNLYLYHVTADPPRRNADLPTRDADGRLIARPQVVVDLHYLIAFPGDDYLAAEVMRGKVLTTLHGVPLIPYPDVARIAAADGAFAAHGDPAVVAEDGPIRLIPDYPTIEEQTRLWSVFFQIPHRPTLFYLVPGVSMAIDAKPPPVLPVLSVDIHARLGSGGVRR